VSQDKPYFFQSYAIVIIAVIALIGFKQVLPSKIFTETPGNTKNVVVDSLMLEASKDTLDTETDTLTNTKIRFTAKNGVKFPSETFEDYKGYQHLAEFYEQLLQLETSGQGNVRIAYFGDSMTDGDLIVKDFRASLQDRFGGEGVGFVNITSESAPSRSTLTHQFSNNWKTQSYLNVKKPIKPFGINGHVFFVKRDTVNPVWVKYKAVNTGHISALNNPTLFYGRSGNTQARVRIVVGNDTIKKNLAPVSQLNTLKLGDNFKTFKADFIKADSIPFYGFNFDDGRGVHVDNFSNRGNSGLPIGSFNTSLMQAFDAKLGYDLIVLHYGTNVLNYGSTNYTWYEKRMANVVAHLRECFPGVTILIISTADKSTKYNTKMMTDSAVAPLALAQKRYAVKTESAYVNLYTLMGGDGSMVKWVDEVPALANKDYTHFNMRGAKKVSGLIYDQLNAGYEQYKKLRGKGPQAKRQGSKPDSTRQNIDSTNAE
jgi:lysophospholipase L1-like esterase